MTSGASWHWQGFVGAGPWLWLVALAVVLLASWAERRGGRGFAALLAWRLAFLAWLTPVAFGLEARVEIEEPRPARYALLVDDTASVRGRPEVEAAVAQARDTLLGRLALLGDVEVHAYRGRAHRRLWESGHAATDAAGGPTHMLEDLPRLSPTLLAGGTSLVLLGDGADRGVGPAAVVTAPVAVALLPQRVARPTSHWIRDVSTDAYALVRSPLRVRVELGRQPSATDRVEVSVFEGAQALTASTLRFAPGATTAQVALDVLPTHEGEAVYRIELRAGGNPHPEQQVTRVAVRVIRDRLRVLHVVGRPDWDSRLLREVLRNDATVDLVSFQILRTMQNDTGARDAELSLIPFPTRELFSVELPKFDVVLFQNFDYRPYFPFDVSRMLLDNLSRFVHDEGGGFVMTAGDAAFGFGRYEATPLADVLPVRWNPRAGWIPVDGELASDPGWGRWFGAEPPGAPGVIRRVYDAEAARDARVVWRLGERPVVAVAERGAGRSAAVLTDDLWRAPAGGGGTEWAAVSAFWSRLMRYLAGDPAFDDLRVRWQPSRAIPGSEVAVEVEDLQGRPLAEFELVDEWGRVVLRIPAATRARFRLPDVPGAFRLRVGDRLAPEPLVSELPLVERTDLDIDRAAWRSWAAAQGALLGDLEQAGSERVMAALRAQARSVRARDIQPVSDLPGFWLVGLVLLAGELAWRRLSGRP